MKQNCFQKIINFKKNHVHPQGDSIEEINAKTRIGKLLYQGDIVLTRLSDTINLLNRLWFHTYIQSLADIKPTTLSLMWKMELAVQNVKRSVMRDTRKLCGKKGCTIFFIPMQVRVA